MTHEVQQPTAQVTRRFAYSAERVFDSFLDPVMAKKFMFGANEEDWVRCEIDPRVGGEFIMTVRGPKGNTEHQGEYLEIERPYRLVFTFAVPADSPDHDLVTIDIKPLGDGCELTLTNELAPAWAAYLEGNRAAWEKMLNCLTEALD